jgi:hypothetical protein
MPSCLYWRAARQSLVARYFHLHPLFVRLSRNTVIPKRHTGTVDSTLIEDAGVQMASCYVCEDSDEMAIVELTDASAMHIPTQWRPFKSLFIYRWSRMWANERHVRNFLSHIFIFRGDEMIPNYALEKADDDTRLLRFLLGTF